MNDEKIVMKKKEPYLYPEEVEFEKLTENATWVDSGPEFEERKKMMQQAAENSIAKRKRKAISIKIPQGELDAFKKKSASEGLRYQTKINQLIHLYNKGKLSVIS